MAFFLATSIRTLSVIFFINNLTFFLTFKKFFFNGLALNSSLDGLFFATSIRTLSVNFLINNLTFFLAFKKFFS